MHPIAARYPPAKKGCSEYIMKVDYLAMWQGVGDALDAREISNTFYLELHDRVSIKVFYGKTGRRLIYYTDLLQALATVEPTHNLDAARLWRRLGVSLASGISVANQE